MKKVYAEITLKVCFVADETADVNEILFDMDPVIHLEDRNADVLDVSVENYRIVDVK